MSSKRRWDLVVSSKGRNDFKNNTRVGVVFEDDQGRLQVVIDPGISIHAQEGVYINGYIPKPKDAQGDGGQESGGF